MSEAKTKQDEKSARRRVPVSEHPRSVDAFCRRQGFSRSQFYALLKEGRGPRIMKIGTRTTISPDAEAEFERRMEAEAAAAAAAKASNKREEADAPKAA